MEVPVCRAQPLSAVHRLRASGKRQGPEQAARGRTRCYPGRELGLRASAGWSAACGPPRTQRQGLLSPTPLQAASGPPQHPAPDSRQGRLPPLQSEQCSAAQRLQLSMNAPCCNSSRIDGFCRVNGITFLGTNRLSSSDSGCGACTMTLPCCGCPSGGLYPRDPRLGRGCWRQESTGHALLSGVPLMQELHQAYSRGRGITKY